MAKGSGSTRMKGPGSGGAIIARLPYSTPTAGEYIPVTDRGMTAQQRAYITAFEKQRRNSRSEYGLTVDKDGNIVKERRGNYRAIRWYTSEIPRDGILTHVHPVSKKMASMSNFARSVGKSLSGGDIRTAISTNLKEIRAVTPNYTFSMRRPAGGWGVSAKDFYKDYDATWNRNLARLKAYADAGGDIKTLNQRYGRLNVALDHQTMRELAKKYGFIYTKSRRIK